MYLSLHVYQTKQQIVLLPISARVGVVLARAPLSAFPDNTTAVDSPERSSGL